MTKINRTLPSFAKLAISILMCEAIGIVSGLLSQTEMKTWFITINKPSWNPPAYLFGPVWTFLYLLMGIAM
jgi:translocator protein